MIIENFKYCTAIKRISQLNRGDYMNKKARGLSLNTIIIAALVLLVLVILAVIFTGRMGQWGKETNNCLEQGGSCTEECGEGSTQHPIWKCYDADGKVDTDMHCCLTVS